MADIVDRETRSRMMAGIRGKNTKPEIRIRHALHYLGYRYRLHVKNLPGKPDIVFSKYRAVIFVHGCFWHGHDCSLFKWPSTNPEFWRKKINRNREADTQNRDRLIQTGWRVLEIWECAFKGPRKRSFTDVISDVNKWILNAESKHNHLSGI